MRDDVGRGASHGPSPTLNPCSSDAQSFFPRRRQAGRLLQHAEQLLSYV